MNNLCPKCGVNWLILKEWLCSDGYERELAICLVNNCSGCRNQFSYLLPIQSNIEINILGGEESGHSIKKEISWQRA